MIIVGLQGQLWSGNHSQSSMPHDLDLWPFDPKWIGHILDSWGASAWSFMIIGELQGQFWSGNHFQSSMPHDLDLLTPKSIGHILDSWGASAWRFMIIAGLQGQLWSGNRFQSSMPDDLDLWPFDPEINRAHPWNMRSKCMNFRDHRWIKRSVMVRKPFSIINAPWPWHLTVWPRNQYGTFLTHREHVYEVSWS